jgi:hypothetical protein
MEDYYVSQLGSGLSPYEGMFIQRGHGLFGNFMRGKVMPLLKRVLPYIGRTAMDAGVTFARNISEGNDLRTSAKNVFKKKAFDLAGDAFQLVKRKTGSGMKRRKSKKLKRNCVRRKKKTIKAKPKRQRRTVKRHKSSTLF